MKNNLTFLFLLFFALNATAQSENGIAQIVKGKVINEATNEAISYTNIGIENTYYGTASNEDGNFQLKIPVEMVDQQIFFSAVGYNSLTIPVKSLFDREFNIIKLEPLTYDIEAVDIAAQSKVLVRILRMASENTPYNFIGGPFNLVCNYESEKIIDDSLKISESADVLIYDKNGYSTPSIADAFRNRKYKLEKSQPDYSFASGTINFDELLGMDWVRSATSVLDPALIGQFELALVDEPEIDGNNAWVISFTQTKPTPEGSQDFYATKFEGKITILKDDYSVKKIEGDVKSAKHNRQGKSLAISESNNRFYEDVSYSFEVTYSNLKPDVLMLHKNYRFLGQKVEETNRLSITQVRMAEVKEIATRDYFVE